MSDEEWADPYATIEEDYSDTVQPIKQDLPQTHSKLAQILDTKSTNIYNFKNVQIEIRDLYHEGIKPFDFSTPSPDDLWRSQKKQTIIRKK